MDALDARACGVRRGTLTQGKDPRERNGPPWGDALQAQQGCLRCPRAVVVFTALGGNMLNTLIPIVMILFGVPVLVAGIARAWLRNEKSTSLNR